MIVEPLLNLVLAQGAQTLVLETDAPPGLIRAGESKPLSMPPLGPDMIEMVLSTVLSAAQQADLESRGAVDGDFAAQGTSFTVSISKKGSGYRISFSIPGAGTSPGRNNDPLDPTYPNPSTGPSTGPSPGPSSSPSTVPSPGPSSSPSPDPSPGPSLSPSPGGSTGPSADQLGGRPTLTAPSSEPRGTAGFDPVLDRLLQRARLDDASDVLVSAGHDARVRVGGDLLEIPDSTVDDARLLAFLGPYLSASKHDELRDRGDADLAFVHREVRYRVNVFRQIGGLAAAFRPVRNEAPTLRELGLPEDLGRLVEHRNGLVLMTGTAGSGKSTSLVALLERLNRTRARHVITLEDPIEYTYRPGLALIHQREVGVHVESFSTGLRAALREAPDVILVGEMRDRDTIGAALTAAETGHLVLSTLHCADAAMAVDRIIDAFPEHQQTQAREQLASVLRAVVTQVLLPSMQPPRRVPAYEKLVVNTAVATKIRERRGHQIRSEIHTGQSDGMVPLEVTLARLVRDRLISRDVARAHAHEPRLLDDHLDGRAGGRV